MSYQPRYRRCWTIWMFWSSWWFCWTQKPKEERTQSILPPSAPFPPPGSPTLTPWGRAKAPLRPCWRGFPAGTRTGRWATWSSFSNKWTAMMPLLFSASLNRVPTPRIMFNFLKIYIYNGFRKWYIQTSSFSKCYKTERWKRIFLIFLHLHLATAYNNVASFICMTF